MPLPAPRSDPQNAKARISRIGLATLRRDGFVSLNGTDAPGLVVTRPLTFDGCRLFVNAQVGDRGYIKAEIRNTAGEAVKPDVMSECQPLTTDVLNGQVVWSGQTAVQRSVDQSMRMAFEVKNARLYSFWLE